MPTNDMILAPESISCMALRSGLILRVKEHVWEICSSRRSFATEKVSFDSIAMLELSLLTILD
jgi:hypothetical protein